jgi:ATP-dependent DNA helicase RecG
MDKELKQLIQTGEGYHLEFKESLDKSLIEEVCAFANSSGGKVLLGVSDDGEIKGIRTDNDILSRIQDVVNRLEPKLNIKISVSDIIIVVDVAQGGEKPYGCSRGFFIRIGPNSQKLTRNEIVSFFQKEGRIRFDELENSKADFKRDFDKEAFINFIELSNITPAIDHKFLLENLDCMLENGKMTNAGVLFFARSTEFLLLQAKVVCVLYKGTEKLNILDKKDFYGNIIQNIEDAIMFVKRHINIEYKIENLRREEIPEIPDIALREAIVNAVCHRDYFEKGASVMIEIFDDRVEISNPGGLPSGLNAKEFGTKSVVRNPVIASLLNRADYIEQIGTGINRIKNSVKERGQGSVEFYYNHFFVVTFTKTKKVTERVGEKVGKRVGEKVGKSLTKNQRLIIKSMVGNPNISAKDLSDIIGISKRKIEENISKLKKKELIKRIGSPRGGHWEIIE